MQHFLPRDAPNHALNARGRALRVGIQAKVHHKRTKTIARRPHNAPPVRETGPRTNERIRALEIRLIGADGENLGVVSPQKANALAQDAGLDLVETCIFPVLFVELSDLPQSGELPSRQPLLQLVGHEKETFHGAHVKTETE